MLRLSLSAACSNLCMCRVRVRLEGAEEVRRALHSSSHLPWRTGGLGYFSCKMYSGA